MAAEDSSPLTPADTRRAHSKEFSVAAQAFRRVAKPSASGHHLLRSILAMLALPYNAAVEQPILAYRTAGARFSLYDQYKSLTAIRGRPRTGVTPPFWWYALRSPVWTEQ